MASDGCWDHAGVDYSQSVDTADMEVAVDDCCHGCCSSRMVERPNNNEKLVLIDQGYCLYSLAALFDPLVELVV